MVFCQDKRKANIIFILIVIIGLGFVVLEIKKAPDFSEAIL